MKRAAGLLVLLALLGCKGSEKPLPGNCVVQPDRLDYGTVLPPQSDLVPVKVERKVTVGNQPPTTSPAGNEDISGSVVILLDAPQPTPPLFHIIPESTDPDFVIAARDSRTYTIEAVIRNTTSTGSYGGIIDLGSFCSAVAYTLFVAARSEPPPSYVLEWGERGPAQGQFVYPFSVAVSHDGFVYVVDRDNHRYQKFTSGGGFLGAWSEWQERDDMTGQVDTHFDISVGVAVNDAGEIYITDREPELKRNRVTKFAANGDYITHWGPIRKGGSIFGRVWHLDVDAQDRIYVLDNVNHEVVKFELTDAAPYYIILDRWGSMGTGPGKFTLPYGLAVDRRNGDVYVTDPFQHNVQKFASDGQYLLSWGGQGNAPGKFDEPNGVAVDAAGNVYVADNQNRRIQKFDENGAYLTDWGIPGTGPGELTDPIDVAVGDAGDIYVVDASTHRILKFMTPPAP